MPIAFSSTKDVNKKLKTARESRHKKAN